MARSAILPSVSHEQTAFGVGSTPQSLRAPIVGRSTELRILEQSLTRVLQANAAHTVTLIGAPGIGKSRLTYEFISRTKERERGVRILRGACRDKSPTFGVIRRILEIRFGISPQTPLESVSEKIRKGVSEVLEDQRVTEFLHFMGIFMGLQVPQTPFIRAVGEDSVQLERIGRVIVKRFLELDAHRKPLVIALEDLHFASDETLSVIHYLTNTVQQAPILFLCSARPELLARKPNWFEADDSHTRIDMEPLSTEASNDLVAHLLAPIGHEPPRQITQVAANMAGGNPYMLEQAVQTLTSEGRISRNNNGDWRLDTARLGNLSLPLTLEEAVRTRIATLNASERAVLETAAAIGDVFWSGALVALSRVSTDAPELWGGDSDELAPYRNVIDSLIQRGYIVPIAESSIANEREFAFKHHLERDMIYSSMVPDKRRNYHVAVAQWLEFKLTEHSDERCDIIASHYEQGGASRRAARYYLQGADIARRRFLNHKAAEYYQHGLELLPQEDAVLRLDALHQYGDILQLECQYDLAIQTFREMLTLAYRLNLRSKGGAAHNRIGRAYRTLGKLDQAMRHLGTAHALFESEEDRRGVASCLDDIGKVHWMRGAFSAAERFIYQALELRRELGDPRSIALSYNNLGLVYQDSGRPNDALGALEQALEIRRKISDFRGVIQTLNNLGTIYQDRGDDAHAAKLWHDALITAEQIGDKPQQAVVCNNLGESCLRLGEVANAITFLSQAEDICRLYADPTLEAEVLRGLARAYCELGQMEMALKYARQAVDILEASNNGSFLAIALRTQAQVMTQLEGMQDEARASLQRAMEIFQSVGNEVELALTRRAYTSLGAKHALTSEPKSPTDERETLGSRSLT